MQTGRGACPAADVFDVAGVTSRRRIHQKVYDDDSIAGGRQLRLTFHADGGHPIPALLLLPDAGVPRPPAALMLHGYSSRKEAMATPIGTELLRHGVATLSIDLPLHGTRADPLQQQSARNPFAMTQLWRQGLADARLALHYLAARAETDTKRIALLGYSMGAFLSVSMAPDEPLVRAVVLAAGGDLPDGTPFSAVARMVADPLKAVRRFGGRPLLMVHGRQDRTVLPEQARRLFDAASEPKQILWYDAGHHLPQTAIHDVADWLERHV